MVLINGIYSAWFTKKGGRGERNREGKTEQKGKIFMIRFWTEGEGRDLCRMKEQREGFSACLLIFSNSAKNPLCYLKGGES